MQDSRPHVEMVAFTGNGVSLTWILSYRWAVALGKKEKENHTGLELRAILSWCLVRKPFHKQKPGPSDFFLIYKLDHEFVFNGFFSFINVFIVEQLYNNQQSVKLLHKELRFTCAWDGESNATGKMWLDCFWGVGVGDVWSKMFVSLNIFWKFDSFPSLDQ